MKFINTAPRNGRASRLWSRLTTCSLMTISMLFFTTATVDVVRAQDDLSPTRNDRRVSKIVATLMQRDHLSARELDDTISKRAFDMYIKSLDPMKVYFYQSDIDEFGKWNTEIDDQMKAGDYEVAFKVFRRFLKRVDERVDVAIELIDAEHDFSVKEEMVTDRDLAVFAKDADEARENWRKRIKYNLLVLKSDEEEKTDPKEKLTKRYNSFAKRMHQTDTDDVVEMYVTAITSSFDPHTSYMSKESFENFLIAMSLQLEGIGATLQSTDDGYTVIKRIVPGGAADKHGGVKVEDKIIGVGQGGDDGVDADPKLISKHGEETVDVTGMKLDDVVKMIRGKAGTIVRLNLMSENSETRTVRITREKIKLEDSAAAGKIFEEDGKKIGVIDLPSFYADMGGDRNAAARSTTKDVRRILVDFKKKNVDAVVLDLRRNGGGSLREAIDCTGLFIDTGPVVQVKDSMNNIQKHNDEAIGMAWDKPLVVLTSKFSASASEILAGAVQDYGRGIVVGDTTTHGKGTVQSLVNLNQLVFNVERPPNMFGALKITMQQFYRPNGDSTQKRGVESDLVLPSISDKMDVGESDLDFPVAFDKIPPANYSSYGMISSNMREKLGQTSADRVAKSEKFLDEIKKIEKYVEQKERKSVSLNEAEFLARRKELNAEKQDEKTIEDQVNHSNTDIKRDYYLDEVLKITADYMRLLNKT